MLMSAAASPAETRFQSDDPEFADTIGRHPTGLGLLSAMGFDVEGSNPAEAPGPGNGPTTTAAPPAPEGSEPPAPAEEGLSSASSAAADAGSTVPAPAGEAGAAGSAASTEVKEAPAPAATVYVFRGSDELVAQMPQLISVLYAVLDGPMPEKPDDDDGALPADDGLDDPTRAIMEQLVARRFYDLDIPGTGLAMLSDENMGRATDHAGTLVGMIRSFFGERDVHQAAASLVATVQQLVPIMTGPDSERSTTIVRDAGGHHMAMGALTRIVSAGAIAALAARWSAALTSGAVTPEQLTTAVMTRIGRKLRSDYGEAFGATLLLAVRDWPFVSVPFRFAEVRGVAPLTEEQAERKREEATLRRLQVRDTEVEVEVVPRQRAAVRPKRGVTDAIVIQAHNADVARRVAAMLA